MLCVCGVCVVCVCVRERECVCGVYVCVCGVCRTKQLTCSQLCHYTCLVNANRL